MKLQVIELLLVVVPYGSTDGKQLLLGDKPDSESCPDAPDIAPCVCSYFPDVNATDLDCSAVEGEDQLKQIFTADFPLKKFRRFSLSGNKFVKVLESYVFNDTSFEWINIQDNELEVIEMHALDSCYDTATHVDISSNKLTTFPFDILTQFSRLKMFSISNNPLSIILADAFRGLTTLEYIYLQGTTQNIVGTFQDLPNLEFIYLVNDDLTIILTNFINTGSSSLREVVLQSNNIVSVEPGAFDIVEDLNINLMDNSLSILEEVTWRPYLEAGAVLYAVNNPLICGCDIAWLFGQDHLKNHIIKGTTCITGEDLHDLDPSIFDPC
ncbi:unnamed protein product [Meganyctiphanes norvegica]|uniref:Oplophorus-luciferin 2-monooxygenase non-catalytic subunit n=1 Tax=Meganyctiphanes norvegica TaxID=48144 RepID=A0AAV2Q877_MEGNR